MIEKGVLPADTPIDPQSNFEFAENIEEHCQKMKQAGFSQVKYWYQPMNLQYRDGEDYVSNFGMVKGETGEMRAEIVRLYDELSGAGTHDLKTFEIMNIVAYKD